MVVSNIFLCSPRKLGKMNPFWLYNIFPVWVETTNQELSFKNFLQNPIFFQQIQRCWQISTLKFPEVISFRRAYWRSSRRRSPVTLGAHGSMGEWWLDFLMELGVEVSIVLFFFGGGQKMSRGTMCLLREVNFFCQKKRQVLNESNIAMRRGFSSSIRLQSTAAVCWSESCGQKSPHQKAKAAVRGGAVFGGVWGWKWILDMERKAEWFHHFHFPSSISSWIFNHFQFHFQLHVGIQPFSWRWLSGSANFVAILECGFGSGAAAMRKQHVEVTLSR